MLAAVLPASHGPTAAAPVAMDDSGLELADGIEAKQVILTQLAQALEIIRRHDPARIVTRGGECAVSVAPFSELARRYGDDLAIIWIDSHPDIGTPAGQYPGFHAMAVAALTGHGDPQVQELLPAIVSADRVALVGLHAWATDDIANVARWGSAPSARTTCGQRPSRWGTGSPPPAAPASLSISTSTPSTATSSCSGLALSRAG